MRGVSIEYRFAAPEHPFPAAVEDSVTAYRGLLASGIFALLIPAGSHEILLDDALRVAARAAEADDAVPLEITLGVPHVFQGFTSALYEGAAALDSVATILYAQLGSTLEPCGSMTDELQS